jgi:hypothetical protein
MEFSMLDGNMNREDRNAYMREWKRNNKEKVNAVNRQTRARKPKKYRAINRRSIAKQRAANPTKYNQQRWALRANDPIKYLWKHARERAQKIKVLFSLELADIIIPEFCPVLGIKLEWGFGQRAAANKASPSLDRMDGKLGYVKGNVFVISNRANHLKNNGTLDEFERIVAYMRGAHVV